MRHNIIVAVAEKLSSSSWSACLWSWKAVIAITYQNKQNIWGITLLSLLLKKVFIVIMISMMLKNCSSSSWWSACLWRRKAVIAITRTSKILQGLPNSDYSCWHSFFWFVCSMDIVTLLNFIYLVYSIYTWWFFFHRASP